MTTTSPLTEPPKLERWIVRYRRYSSDPWTEEPFANEAEARRFATNKYSYEQTAAQVEVRHFVEV